MYKHALQTELQSTHDLHWTTSQHPKNSLFFRKREQLKVLALSCFHILWDCYLNLILDDGAFNSF